MELTKERILEVFYDKALSDVVRHISINSPLEIENAIVCIHGSKNYKRDKEMVIKMSCAGFDIQRIKQMVQIMNN